MDYLGIISACIGGYLIGTGISALIFKKPNWIWTIIVGIIWSSITILIWGW